LLNSFLKKTFVAPVAQLYKSLSEAFKASKVTVVLFFLAPEVVGFVSAYGADKSTQLISKGFVGYPCCCRQSLLFICSCLNAVGA
jgi:hypothetical protein